MKHLKKTLIVHHGEAETAVIVQHPPHPEPHPPRERELIARKQCLLPPCGGGLRWGGELLETAESGSMPVKISVWNLCLFRAFSGAKGYGERLQKTVFLGLFIVALLLGMRVAEATEVTINPNSAMTYVGELISLDITMDQVSELGGFQFGFYYDPAILEIRSPIRINTAFNQVVRNQFDNLSGKGLVAAYALGVPSVSGENVALATVDFFVKGVGESDIIPLNVILGEIGGTEIPSTTLRGRLKAGFTSCTEIAFPSNGATLVDSIYTIKGTACGAVSEVQKVEVSTDGGATWNPAEGTISWTYDWQIPADGSYVIQSRTTDISGIVELPGSGISVQVYKREPSLVSLSGRQLLVNGVPITVKGVGYAPTPIGDDPELKPPHGDYFTSEYSAIYNRDLPLLRSLRANAVRLWGWQPTANHVDFLDKAYHEGVDPIYVIAGYWINGGLDIDPTSPNNLRDEVKADFRAMVALHKNHPALLMWTIGNELNADWNYGGNLEHLFSLINEMALEAHAEEGINFHPVTTALMDKDLISTVSAYNAALPGLDIWSANVYRGSNFGTLFADYKAVSEKPLMILEFGIDSYDHTHKAEYEHIGRPYQAQYAESLWTEIAGNSEVCIGGSYMAYSDEWWKGKYSTDPGCPEKYPFIQWTCGYASPAHPDGYADEEFWGLMRVRNSGTETDVMEPRAVYYTLQALWSGVVRGDLNGDSQLDLADAILALQVVVGVNPPGIRSDYATSNADVNGDNRIGLPEVLYILQKIAGLRY